MKQIRIILIILLITLCFLSISNYAYAVDPVGDMLKEGGDFIKKGEAQGSLIETNEMKEFSDTVYIVLVSLGAVIAVVVGIVLGIQFMYSSTEDKAKTKENLVTYAIGCVALFGAFTIWKIVIEIFNTLS